MNKKNIFSAGLAIALLYITVSVPAAPEPYSVYSRSSTNGATALSGVIIGANSVNAGTAVVTMLDAISDKPLSVIQSWRVTGETVETATNSNVSLTVAVGAVDTGTVIIRHLLTDTYEKRTLTTSTNATNLILTVAPLQPVVPGDIVYYASTAGAAKIGLSTNSFVNGPVMGLQLSGSTLLSGQKGKPLMVEVDGTSSATLNGVTARFEP